MRCGDCRFWGKPDEGDDRYRTCTAVVHAPGRWDPTQVDPEEVGDRKAAVVDGSGFFAALKPRQDFGCVLFEPRQSGGAGK